MKKLFLLLLCVATVSHAMDRFEDMDPNDSWDRISLEEEARESRTMLLCKALKSGASFEEIQAYVNRGVCSFSVNSQTLISYFRDKKIKSEEVKALTASLFSQEIACAIVIECKS